MDDFFLLIENFWPAFVEAFDKDPLWTLTMCLIGAIGLGCLIFLGDGLKK